jgi:GR25 family glycosyltransferase involved in LPS biosynthesis
MLLLAFNLLTKQIVNESKTKEVNDDFIQIWNILFDQVINLLTEYKFFKLPSKEHPNIVLTMTSCKRLNLFQQTVNSIINTWDDLSLVDQFIVIDDNSSVEDRVIMKDSYLFIEYIMKSQSQKGHLESMNMIYDMLYKRNPTYWIHIEDDFLFFVKMSYVTLGIKGLTELSNFNVKQIMFNRNYVETFDKINMPGHVPYINSSFSFHDYKPGGGYCQYWPYFSFRPSIIDVNTIISLGKFTSDKTFFEHEYAKKWTSNGYKTAFINTVTNIHIGKLCNTNGDNAYSLNEVPQFNNQTFKSDYNIKVINMNNRLDRLQKITESLDKEKLSFQRVEAVDGKSLKLTCDILKLFKNNDFGFRRGFIGCALSHYNLWKELVASDKSYYVIMEDDATFCDNFAEKLEELLKIRNYDLLFLGYHIKQNNIFDKNVKEVNVVPLNIDLYIGGTHCYIITKNGASTLMDYIDVNGIKHGIDYLMVKEQKILSVYETFPHISFSEWVKTNESDTDSDIQYDYSSVSLNVSDKYIFLEGLDQISSDCFIAEKHLLKGDYETMADSIEGCIAFNTLGYFKNDIVELVRSPYFNNGDGIYINKDYYFNVFKKK